MDDGREVCATRSHECTPIEGEKGNVFTEPVEPVWYDPLASNEDQATEPTVCVSYGPQTKSGLDQGNQEGIASNEDQRKSQPVLMKPALDGVQDEAVQRKEKPEIGETNKRSASR